MFIREKIISNQPYAYLVRTKWDKRSKKVKQKVSKYLGKIQRLDRIKNTTYTEYYHIVNLESHISDITLQDLVHNLIELELHRHGFFKKSKHKMTNGSITIDIEFPEHVYALNEGFLHRKTILEIYKYDKLLSETINNVPFRFAALFVNAGLDIEKDLFIELYQRFFSDQMT